MVDYNYKARDRSGELRQGMIRASSKSYVRAQLRRMRLVPLSIAEEKKDKKSLLSNFSMEFFYYHDKNGRLQIRFGYQWPKTRDLAIFSRQFSSMLGSGVAMLKCLEILRDQQALYDFGKTIEEVRASVERGKPLGESLEVYSHVFKPLYIAMVKAGETSGQLDIIMRKLSEHLDKVSKIISQVKSALYYPVVVMVLSIAIIVGMLIFVVPVFAQQFESSGHELPALTRWVINASNFIRDNYIAIGICIVAIVIGIRIALKTDKGRRFYDKNILKVPQIGHLIHLTVISRFCYTMSAMLSGGVNMIEALGICAIAADNKTVEDNILQVRGDVERGEGLADSMRDTDIFPNMVISMTEVGEQTGALDAMLAKIAEIFEEEVEEKVKALLSLLEPLTIVIIGGCIGFIVVAMYLPIFDLAKTVGPG